MNGVRACMHEGVLIVRETAPWSRQLGLQAVMQAVVTEYPESTMPVRVLFNTYNGKPLKRMYNISNGLYAPLGRAITNWRDKTGKKVAL